MKRRLVILLVGTLVFWGLLAIPATILWGNDMLLTSGAAAVLCLIPTTVTLAWGTMATGRRRPGDVLFQIVGSMGLRMTFVLGGGLVLYKVVPRILPLPALSTDALGVWIVIFYLITLALETRLLAVSGGAKALPHGNEQEVEA